MSPRTPLQKRQLEGALNRVPKDFYNRVWEILEKTPGGIKVAGYLLPQVIAKFNNSHVANYTKGLKFSTDYGCSM